MERKFGLIWTEILKRQSLFWCIYSVTLSNGTLTKSCDGWVWPFPALKSKTFPASTSMNAKRLSLAWLFWRKPAKCVWLGGFQIALEQIGSSLLTFTAPVRRSALRKRREPMSRCSPRFRFQDSCLNDGHREDRSNKAKIRS